MRNAQLKVKRLSLGAEAAIIKLQQAQWLSKAQKARIAKKLDRSVRLENVAADLYLHRVSVVKVEARAAHLANAFLRGQKYQDIEKFWYRDSIGGIYGYEKLWDKVVKNVLNFGNITFLVGERKGNVSDIIEAAVFDWRDEHPQSKSNLNKFGLERKKKIRIRPDQRAQSDMVSAK